MSAAPDRVPEGVIKLTYDEYVGLPNDGKRYEILDGELAVTPAPTLQHQAVSRDLQFILHAHIKAKGLGVVYDAPVDVILARTTVVQPDLVFVATDRAAILTERAVEGTPDLTVEILSPHSLQQDRVTKAKLYARYGVPYYWVVDPAARTLEEYRLVRRSYRLLARHAGSASIRTALFPDLAIDLSQVWS